MNFGNRIHGVLGFALIGALCLMALVPPAALAAQAPLPPRPTPTFVPVVEESSESAAIMLSLQADGGTAATLDWAALWTVVEWQDDQGAWHVVEGWQAPFDEMVSGTAKKVWGVEDSMLGKGPFRWVVYGQKGGSPLVVSDLFYLPGSSTGTVAIRVTLGGDVAPMLLPVSGSAWAGVAWLLAVGLLMVLAGMILVGRRREA